MQVKLDQEKSARQHAEDGKFEMEKKKNELLVDLEQIRSQSSKLATDLKGTSELMFSHITFGGFNMRMLSFHKKT